MEAETFFFIFSVGVYMRHCPCTTVGPWFSFFFCCCCEKGTTSAKLFSFQFQDTISGQHKSTRITQIQWKFEVIFFCIPSPNEWNHSLYSQIAFYSYTRLPYLFQKSGKPTKLDIYKTSYKIKCHDQPFPLFPSKTPISQAYLQCLIIHNCWNGFRLQPICLVAMWWCDTQHQQRWASIPLFVANSSSFMCDGVWNIMCMGLGIM